MGNDPKVSQKSRPGYTANWGILDGALEKYPFRVFIYLSIALALLGWGGLWLSQRLSGWPWIGTPLKVVSYVMMGLSAPGLILERFYIPNGEQRVGGPKADKALYGFLIAAVVATILLVLFVHR